MAAVDNPAAPLTEPDTVEYRDLQGVFFTDHVPDEVVAWLERRRALGNDRFDEVWEGVLRVVTGPGDPHGDLYAQVAELLGPRARAAGLKPRVQSNIGERYEHRVPDYAIFRETVAPVWNPTAAVVVEVLSPRDPAYQKFDFYRRCDVEEILIVDGARHAVEWYAATADGYARAPGSALLGITEDEMLAVTDWPPPATDD